MNWLVNGAMAGAAIGLGAVAIVGTGGLAAAAIVGGLAAGGAGIGEVLSTMSWAPKEVCGVIKGAGSNNVFINGIPAARAHVDVVECYKHSPPYLPIATGSATVYINDQPAARVDDKAVCSAVITSGSHDVFIGGDTTQTDVLEPENLVQAGVHAALLVVGIGSAIVLGGPIIAAVGLAGGTLGQLGGEWLGGETFGIGSDGQRWAMLGGSLLGGAVGAKVGAGIAGRWSRRSLLEAQGAIGRIPPKASEIDLQALREQYGVNKGNLQVEATFEHNGKIYYDVNQTARNPALATSEPLPIFSESKALAGAPNQSFASAHAEVGAMGRAFADGNLGGDATLNIHGKDACSFCVSDVKRMALQLQLDSLTVIQPSGTVKFVGPKDFAPIKQGGLKW